MWERVSKCWQNKMTLAMPCYVFLILINQKPDAEHFRSQEYMWCCVSHSYQKVPPKGVPRTWFMAKLRTTVEVLCVPKLKCSSSHIIALQLCIHVWNLWRTFDCSFSETGKWIFSHGRSEPGALVLQLFSLSPLRRDSLLMSLRYPNAFAYCNMAHGLKMS